VANDADVIGGGNPDRPPRRWPGATALLVLVLVAVIAALLNHPHGDHPAAVSSSGPPSTGTSIAAPRPSLSLPPPDPGLACGPCDPVLTASPGHGPPGLRLAVPGSRAVQVVDTATGAVTADHRIPVPPGERVLDIVPLDHGIAALVTAIAGTTAAVGTVWSLNGSGRVARLGQADFIFPGTDGDSIWTATYGRPDNGPYLLQDVSATGVVRTALVEPDDVGVVAGTDQGLILTTPVSAATAPAGTVQVMRLTGSGLQPVSPPNVTSVIAVNRDHVAWSTTSGELVVEDLVTGDERIEPVPDVQLAVEGSFSPDSRRLAFVIGGRIGTDAQPASYGTVRVFDIAAGYDIVVDGVRLAPKQMPGVGWTSSGTLVLELRFDANIRLAFWAASGDPTTALGAVVHNVDVPELRVVPMPR